MLTGAVPFPATSHHELYTKVMKGQYTLPEGLSNFAVNLINCLIRVDPKQRISFKEFKSHPFIELEPEVYK
jgi:serine/threonine protein kinase